jgi:hypothetical protein
MEHAEAMTDTPPTVDDDLVNELRAHLDSVPLVELAALVCVENVRSRINSALGLTPQEFKERCDDLPRYGAGVMGGDAASRPDASIPSGMAHLQPIETRRQDGRDR